MTAAIRILAEARAKGVELSLGKAGTIDLRWEDELSEGLKDRIAAHKLDLILILKAEAFAGRPVIRIDHIGGKRTRCRVVFVFEDDSDCPVNLDMTLKKGRTQ